MSFEASTQDPRASTESGAGLATLRFRRDQISSGVSRLGRLRPGGQLHVEYDPGRLMPEYTGPGTPDIVCHVRFYPGGKERSGSLQLRPGVIVGPGLFEAIIPPGTSSVEIWFERREGNVATGWDSRYGQNYRFAVTQDGLPVPERSVQKRENAIVDPARIHVVEDTASKAQTSIGVTGAALQTGVRIRARLPSKATTEPLTAWADVHVFDASDDLIHNGTITLEREAPTKSTSADGERVWDADVYQGSGGGSGAGVWFRPDAHTVQYRLYCQVGDTLYTDGVLHQFEVPADMEVRPTGTTW
jgi:hypothetical protein